MDYSVGPVSSQVSLEEGGRGRFEHRGRGHAMTKARGYTASIFEDGGRSHAPRNAVPGAGKGKTSDLPLGPLEKARPCQHTLISAQ